MDNGFTTKEWAGSRREHTQIFENPHTAVRCPPTKKSRVSVSFMLTLPVPDLTGKNILEKNVSSF